MNKIPRIFIETTQLTNHESSTLFPLESQWALPIAVNLCFCIQDTLVSMNVPRQHTSCQCFKQILKEAISYYYFKQSYIIK